MEFRFKNEIDYEQLLSDVCLTANIQGPNQQTKNYGQYFTVKLEGQFLHRLKNASGEQYERLIAFKVN